MELWRKFVVVLALALVPNQIQCLVGCGNPLPGPAATPCSHHRNAPAKPAPCSMGILAPTAPAPANLSAAPAHDLIFPLANYFGKLVPHGPSVPVHASPPDSLRLTLKI